MPRAFLSLLPLLFLAYFYCGWKLFHSFTNILPWPKEQIIFYLVGILCYLNLHPFLLLILHVFKFKKLAKSVREGFKLWDILFTYPFWIGLILIVEVLPLLLVLDFVKLPFYPFYDRFKSIWLPLQYRVTLAIFAVFLIYVLIRLLLDTNRIRISRVNYSSRNLPANLDGLQIVHISDVQADPRTKPRKVRRYVKKVNRLNPDLIFFTGDLVTSGKKFIALAAELLGKLEAKYGVFGCLGDHDVWADSQRVLRHLNENKITTVEDKNHFVRIGFDSLMVTFITNTYSRRANLEKLNYLMGQQPRGALDILISHQPSETVIELAAERGYHIFLAGHTHGGQVVFKPFGFTLTPPRFETPYYKGIYGLGRMLVSVNNGLGLTFAPLRYRAPAEVTLIKILKSRR